MDLFILAAHIYGGREGIRLYPDSFFRVGSCREHVSLQMLFRWLNHSENVTVELPQSDGLFLPQTCGWFTAFSKENHMQNPQFVEDCPVQ